MTDAADPLTLHDVRPAESEALALLVEIRDTLRALLSKIDHHEEREHERHPR